MAYLIAKSRVLRIIGGILDFLSSLRSDSYNVILGLEEELSQAHLQVPPQLRLSSPVNSADHHPSLISKRIQLEYLYYKECVCCTENSSQRAGSMSTQRCVESAMPLLSLQETLHQEIKAIESAKASHWFRIPLTIQDSILSSMILYMEL